MQRNFLVSVYIVATFFGVSSVAFDYCTMNCHRNGTEVKHIACDNDGEFGRNCPENIQPIIMDKDLQEFIVRWHNDVRNKVAAGENRRQRKHVCRMGTVQWDNGLAEMAALSSKRCTNEVDYCHSTQNFPTPGQIADRIFLLDGFSIAEGLGAVFVHFGNDYILNGGKEIMVAEQNTRVGCAGYTSLMYRLYQDRLEKLYWVVCNYSTDNTNLDICDAPGEKCKTGKNLDYSNLCSKNETY